MATPKQIEANRRNARRSTGPRSAAGKAIASANAIRTGLHANRHLVLASLGESAFDHDAHQSAVLAELAPVGTVESSTAATIASLLWRLRRIPQLESAALHPGTALPVDPDRVQPHCSITLVRPAPDAPTHEHLARVRHDLYATRNDREAAIAARRRLKNGLRVCRSDDGDDIPEFFEIQSAVNDLLGWTLEAASRWKTLAFTLADTPEADERPPWTAPRLAQALEHLAAETGQDADRFRKSILKHLDELIVRRESIIAEREVEEARLCEEMLAERNRAAAVEAFGSEQAVTGIHKAEQHLAKQLERTIALLGRLQDRRRKLEPPTRSEEHLRLNAFERSFGFVLPELPAAEMASWSAVEHEPEVQPAFAANAPDREPDTVPEPLHS